MTQKRVKASDVIGNSYYIYTLQSSNNTPSLNSTISITCNVTNVYGQAVSGKSITLYQNNTSQGTKTTDSNGNASWNSISMSSAGLQVFKVENSKIEVFVDNKSDVGHTHSQYLTEHQSLSNYVTTDDSRLSDSRTPTSHTHGNLQNNGQVGSTAQANKNVVTNSSGLITTEDKPTIPSASTSTPSADTTSGSYGSGTTYARANHTHPKSSIYAEATHTHSQYLTEHQSLSNYVTTDDSRLSDSRTPTSHTHGNLQNNGQVGSTAQANKNVVTNSSGLITTEDKPTIPSASSTTPSADTTNGSVGTGTTWARSNHTHPKSSLYAESSHSHTKSQITDFPTIPSKTSDLTNDSGFLTSHQDISGKLDKTQTSYKGKNVVVDSSSGNITFEEKNNHTHSNYLTSTDISGKIDTAGTGLSKSGTTLNHSNSVTALTTASLKKVKYDAQGHITGTSDVSASDLPTHTHSQYLTSHQDITGKEDSSNKVSSWNSTTNDIRYPTEKLVKDSLDSKVDSNNLKTINNQSLIGNGNIDTNNRTLITGSADDIFTQGKYYKTTGIINTTSQNQGVSFLDVLEGPLNRVIQIVYEYDITELGIIGYEVAMRYYDTTNDDWSEWKYMVGNEVTSWSTTVSDSRIPTEKLVKDSLDGKSATSHTHSGYASSSHTHGTWSSTSISNGTLYYNSAIRLCSLRYSRTFNSASANTMYEWGQLIPSGYRPKYMVSGSGNRNGATIIIDSDGYVYGRFAIAFSSSTDFYYHIMWHY